MIPNTILMWREVIEYLAKQPAGTSVHVESHRVEHPRDGGLGPMMGIPVGQRGDWGGLLSDGTLVAARDFGSYYDVKLHARSPASALAMPSDTSESISPQAMVLGLTALGALLGLALGRSKDGVLTGALLGGATALTGLAVGSAQGSPETSRAAFDALELVSRAMTAKSAQVRTGLAPERSLPPKRDDEEERPARRRKPSTAGRKRAGS
jgi:hypothetical protein